MISAKIIEDSLDDQGNRLTTFEVTCPGFTLEELNTHTIISYSSTIFSNLPFEKMIKMVQENPFIPIAWKKDTQTNEYWTTETIKSHYVPMVSAHINTWLEARDNAIHAAQQLNKNGGVTQQLCNILLEPFIWHKAIITGDKKDFEDFFKLKSPQYPQSFINDSGGEETIYHKSKKDRIDYCGYPNNTFLNLKDGRSVNILEMQNLDWILYNHSQEEIHIQTLAECMWDAMNQSKPNQI